METQTLTEDGLEHPSFREVKALLDDLIREWKEDKACNNWQNSPLFYILVHYADEKWLEDQIENRGIFT